MFDPVILTSGNLIKVLYQEKTSADVLEFLQGKFHSNNQDFLPNSTFVKAGDGNDPTIHLLTSIGDPDVMHIALQPLSPNERIQALLTQDITGQTALEHVWLHNDDQLMLATLEGFFPVQCTQTPPRDLGSNTQSHWLHQVAQTDKPDLVRIMVSGFLNINGGEKALINTLNELKRSDDKTFKRLADLMIRGYLGPTPESKQNPQEEVDIALAEAKKERSLRPQIVLVSSQDLIVSYGPAQTDAAQDEFKAAFVNPETPTQSDLGSSSPPVSDPPIQSPLMEDPAAEYKFKIIVRIKAASLAGTIISKLLNRFPELNGTPIVGNPNSPTENGNQATSTTPSASSPRP